MKWYGNMFIDNIKNLKGKRNKSIYEYLVIFFAVIVIFVLCRAIGIKNNELKTHIFMIISFVILALYTFYLKRVNRLTEQKIVNCIIIGGIIMRVGYMIYTHMFIRGHDLGPMSVDGTGHLGYIYRIVQNGALPDSNAYQMYHPPLYHICAAVVIKIARLFVSGHDINAAFEFSQIINCTLSCIMLPVLRNFLKEIKLGDKYGAWVMAVIAFYPCFYQMGGRLNNDMFVTFFMFLCVIYTYRWYKKRDIKTIVCLALSFGLGMMSKISCGTMALFTGPMMLYVLYKDFKAKNIKNTIIQLAVFAVICFPLALWYPIRNYILFNQPFNFVLDLGTNSFVYRGNLPAAQRFLHFSFSELVQHPFAEPAKDYSVPMSVVQTAMFGEGTFEARTTVSAMLNIVNCILIVVSIMSMFYVALKDKLLNKKYRFGFLILWVIIFGSFLQFNISYPYICTANLRYIPLTVVIGAVYIAYALKLADKIDLKYMRYLACACKIIIIAFCAFSCMVYI